ncbi:Hsp70 protein that interacts with Zuo1p [Marasmius sp. AFHP31]|nr:Hsp70 protein that interacts with Zuo1p [Marasmius sp. AFHP31]
MLAKSVYQKIADLVGEVAKEKGVDTFLFDEIVYTGSTASLPGFDEHLIAACGLKEDVVSPFAANTVVGGGIGDPSTLLARGAARRVLLCRLKRQQGEVGKKVLNEGEKDVEAKVTSKGPVWLFPSEDDEEQQGGTSVMLAPAEMPLPARGISLFKHHSFTRETLLGAAELTGDVPKKDPRDSVSLLSTSTSHRHSLNAAQQSKPRQDVRLRIRKTQVKSAGWMSSRRSRLSSSLVP